VWFKRFFDYILEIILLKIRQLSGSDPHSLHSLQPLIHRNNRLPAQQIPRFGAVHLQRTKQTIRNISLAQQTCRNI